MANLLWASLLARAISLDERYNPLSYTYDVIQRRRQVCKYDSLTCGQTTGLITGYQTFPIKTMRKMAANVQQAYDKSYIDPPTVLYRR